MTDLFESRLGQRISAAVKTLFTTAPVGKPVLWLAQFGDPEVEGILSDLISDPRAANLTPTYIADTVNGMRKKLIRRKMLDIRRAGADASISDSILRELKSDPRNQSNDPDDLF